jgi:hypothetical protein
LSFFAPPKPYDNQAFARVLKQVLKHFKTVCVFFLFFSLKKKRKKNLKKFEKFKKILKKYNFFNIQEKCAFHLKKGGGNSEKKRKRRGSNM